MKEEIENKLKNIFKQNQVNLAYLFGSKVKDDENSMSDIDFAVLFSEQVKTSDYPDKRLKIASEIGKHVEEEVDVACLNNASILLKHRAVIEGNLIFSAEPDLSRKYETRTLQQYEDFKYYINKNIETTEKQIEKGEFGEAPLKPKVETYFQQKYGSRLSKH